MADARQTVEIVFQGVDKTAAATQAVIDRTKALSGNIESATQPIADFTASAVKLEASILAAGLAITAFSVKVAGDFDTAFREITTLIGQPVEELGEFREAILSYAAESTQPLEKVTQSIYNAISAGIDYGDAIAALSTAEKLAVAGKAELNDSLVVLVSSLNAYGVGMDEAQRFSDALFTTVKQGQTTLPELSASLASVTGLAATAGVDFEELLAAIATLTATGTPTSQAITQIQGAISAILKPTSQASSLAAELGIQFDAERLAAVGLTSILDDVATATDGNTSQMARLFGRVEALNGVLTLTGLGADKFAENLVAMADSAGAVDAAFDIMVDSVGLATQRISNALTGLLVAVGGPLLDEFGGVANAVAAIFNALGDSARSGDGGIAELVAFIESQFQGLQETLETVASNLPAALELADFSGFTNGVQAVADAIGVLFDGIDLTTAEGLASAITIIGRGFESLSEFTGGVIESFKPLFDQITKISKEAANMGPEFFKAAGEVAGFATQANILARSLNDLFPVIEGLVAIIGLNQAVGLVGAFTSASRALTGSTGLLALLGQAGLVGAAGAAGYAVGTLANKAAEVATGTSISTWALDTAINLGLIDDEATRLAESMEGVSDSTLLPIGVIDDIKAADAAMADLSGSTEDLTGKVYNFTTGMWEAADATQDQEAAFAAADAQLAALGVGFDTAADSAGDLTVAANDVADPVAKVAAVTDQATEATRKWNEEIAKMDHAEKLALIEAQSAITVARMQADAEKVVAAYESLNVTIDSTGESITELFGLFEGDKLSLSEKFDVQNQIELENERRQDALDLQKKLTAAQIKQLEAQAAALARGDSIITVQGDGLQPHLEAIMWELLEAIQVRVNQDGLEMLLGAAA